MARSVALSRTPQKVENQSFRYTVTAAGTQMPSEVFVVRRGVLDPVRGTTQDNYDHVATPAELTDLPVNAPVPGQTTYRKSTLVLTFGTRAEADAAWADLKSEVNSLIRALNAGDASLATETVTLTG